MDFVGLVSVVVFDSRFEGCLSLTLLLAYLLVFVRTGVLTFIMQYGLFVLFLDKN